MERNRKTANGLSKKKNSAQDQRDLEDNIESSITSWLSDNTVNENYIPPILSQDEFTRLNTEKQTEIETNKQIDKQTETNKQIAIKKQTTEQEQSNKQSLPLDKTKPNEKLPIRRIDLSISELEENLLINFRKNLIRYEGDWVPSDEEIIRSLIKLLAFFKEQKFRVLTLEDLEDVLKTLNNK